MDFRFKYRRGQAAPEAQAREQREEVDTARRARGMAIGLSIPFTLAGGPVTGWLLGSWLDKLLGTTETHVWTLILILLGTAASMKMTIDLLARLNRQ